MARPSGGYLTSTAAARRIGVSKATLLRAVHRGELDAAMRTPGGQYRFSAADIEAYIRRSSSVASTRREPARARRSPDGAASMPVTAGGQPAGAHGPQTAAAAAPRAESAAHASDERFRTLLETAPIGACVITDDLRFESVNDSLAALLGYRREELIGACLLGLVPPARRETVRLSVAARFAARATGSWDVEVRHRDGRPLTLLVTSAPLAGTHETGRRVVYATDITARARAERAVEEARRLAEALDRVSLALAGTLEPAALYQVILEQAAAVLPADRAIILVYREGWAEVLATRGEPPCPEGTRLFPLSEMDRPWMPAGTGVSYVPDTGAERAWVHYPPFVGEHRVGSALVIALQVEGVPAGMFEIHSRAPHRYGPRDIALAEAFGRRIEQALRNVLLYEAERRRAERLAALQGVTVALSAVRTERDLATVVAREGCAATGAAGCTIRLLTAGGTALARLETDGNRAAASFPMELVDLDALHPACTVFWSGQGVWLERAEEWLARYPETAPPYLATGRQAVAVLPLAVGGRMIGVIGFSFGAPRRFEEEDRAFLTALAELTAQALERARLDEQVRASERELARMFEETALGMAQVAVDGRFLRVNAAGCALLGYSEDELLGMTCQDVTHPEDRELSLGQVRRMMDGAAESICFEKRYLRKDGRVVWGRLSMRAVRGGDGAILYSVSQLEDITGRVEARQAEAALARMREARAAQDAALAAIGAALLGQLELEQVYATILAETMRVLPADYAEIDLHQDGWAVSIASAGEPRRPAGTRLFRLDGPDAGWVPRHGAVYLRDTAQEPAWRHFAPHTGAREVRSTIAAPLVIEGARAGSLFVASHTPDRFSEEQVPFIVAIAERAGLALRSARRYAAERAWARREAALQEVAAALSAAPTPAEVARVVVEQGCMAVGSARGALRLLSADGATLNLIDGEWLLARGAPAVEALRLDQATAHGLAAMTGEPVWLPTRAEWLRRFPGSPLAPTGGDAARSAMVLPLTAHGRRIGTLGFTFTEERAFSPDEQAFALTLAGYAAQALERALLYAAEQERARLAEELAALRAEQTAEASALAEVSAALADVLEPEPLYRRILEQAARVLPCDFARVVLPEDGWVVAAASWGQPSPPPGTRLYALDNPDRMWLPDQQEPVTYVEDTDRVPGWKDLPPWVGENRQRSLLTVPLRIEGQVLGYFSLGSRRPGAYTPRHRERAVLFAERALQALRNARLYAAERERARAAEELAQLREDFVSGVSHELRTPLTAIVGYAELVEAHWTQMSEEDRLDRVRRIAGAANRQKRLVEDVLLIGRLDGEEDRPAREPIQIAALLREAATVVIGAYSGQPVDLAGSDDVWALGDAGRVLQVLVNLLDNAAKYSPECSAIRAEWGVEAAKQGVPAEWVVVDVEDRGRGVPEAGRTRLFTRFGRMPESRVRSGRVGVGLGLYLSRRLARSMGGELELLATGPGGSTFRLRLPLAPAPARMGA